MDYSNYEFGKGERVREVAVGSAMAFGVLYLFYQSVVAVALLSAPFLFLYLSKKKKDKAVQRRNRINLDFKECVLSLSTALSAGYSVENAFEEARKDLALLFEADADIMVELRNIVKQLQMNRNIETLLEDFAVRSGVEDIANFTDVFVTAKRTGGDMIQIMRRTAKHLNQKVEVNREIETMIAAKKLESRIMSVVPLAIIAYMWLFSPGYLAPLYHNLFGILFMTAALCCYVLAYYLMNRITDISA